MKSPSRMKSLLSTLNVIEKNDAASSDLGSPYDRAFQRHADFDENKSNLKVKQNVVNISCCFHLRLLFNRILFYSRDKRRRQKFKKRTRKQDKRERRDTVLYTGTKIHEGNAPGVGKRSREKCGISHGPARKQRNVE